LKQKYHATYMVKVSKEITTHFSMVDMQKIHIFKSFNFLKFLRHILYGRYEKKIHMFKSFRSCNRNGRNGIFGPPKTNPPLYDP